MEIYNSTTYAQRKSKQFHLPTCTRMPISIGLRPIGYSSLMWSHQLLGLHEGWDLDSCNSGWASDYIVSMGSWSHLCQLFDKLSTCKHLFISLSPSFSLSPPSVSPSSSLHPSCTHHSIQYKNSSQVQLLPWRHKLGNFDALYSRLGIKHTLAITFVHWFNMLIICKQSIVTIVR